MRANGLVGHDGLTDTVFSVVVHVLIEPIEVVAVVAARAVVGVVLRPVAELLRDALVAHLREARWAVAMHVMDVEVIFVAIVTVAVPQVAPAAATATVPPVMDLVFIHLISLNIVAVLLCILIILRDFFSICNFLLILTANIIWVLVFILLVELVEYIQVAQQAS